MTPEELEHRLVQLSLQSALLERLLLEVMTDFEAMRSLLDEGQRQKWEQARFQSEPRVQALRDCLARNVEREHGRPPQTGTVPEG